MFLGSKYPSSTTRGWCKKRIWLAYPSHFCYYPLRLAMRNLCHNGGKTSKDKFCWLSSIHSFTKCLTKKRFIFLPPRSGGGGYCFCPVCHSVKCCYGEYYRALVFHMSISRGKLFPQTYLVSLYITLSSYISFLKNNNFKMAEKNYSE